MITKKSFAAIILIAFLASSLLSMIAFTRNAGTDDFTIWSDINGDGTVDIFDAIHLSNAFGQDVGAINKTALLLECNATYASLMSRMDYLNASFIDLLSAVQGMNATNLMPLINNLNASILQLQSDMDALDTTIGQLQTNLNSLGTMVTQLQTSNASLWNSLSQLAVQVENINATLSTRIGVLEGQVAAINTTLASMNATITQLQNLVSSLNDTVNYLNQTVTYLNSTTGFGQPSYDSGWVNITTGTGQYMDFFHNLNTTDLFIDIQGRTTIDGNITQRYLGLTSYLSGWSRTYNGSSEDMVRCVIQTSDGGYAFVGPTETGFPYYSQCNFIKLDALGNVEWQKTWGGTNYEYAYSLIQTRDGGYAFVGLTASFGNGKHDVYLVKTNATGDEQWTKSYGAAEDDEGWSLVQTSDNGYAIGGLTYSYGSSGDMLLVKTDQNGNQQWVRNYGGANYDCPYANTLIITRDGGYAMAGYTNSSGAGLRDMYFVKTDASGNVQWTKTYGGSGYDEAHAIIQTNDGGYALAGETDSYGGNVQCWLVKTDSSGNAQWNRTYGGASWDKAYSLVQTDEGGYALAGYTWSFGAGGYDFWLVKTDRSGNVQYARTYGTPVNEIALSMIRSKDGSYVLAGYKQYSTGSNIYYWLVKTDTEFGLAQTDLTDKYVTLYRGATDPYWNYVRIRIWKLE